MAIDAKQDIQSGMIPFVGNTTTRDGTDYNANLLKDQFFQNVVFWATENSQTGKKTFAVESRPGYLNVDNVSLTFPRAVYYWKGVNSNAAGGGAGIGYYAAGYNEIRKNGTAIVSGLTSPFIQANASWAESLPTATNEYVVLNGGQRLYVINSAGVVTILDSTVVSTVAVGSPSTITTATDHGLVTGVRVVLRGVTGSTPDVNGTPYVITVTGPTTFTIPVNVTIAGTGGTLGDFPVNNGSIVNMNGYFYVMTYDGRIFNSAFNDPLDWDPTDFLTAQMMPGDWLALARQNNFLVALSSGNLQTFIDVANPTGSPLENYESGMQQIGCASAGCLATDGANLTWVGSTTTGDMTVYTMQGLTNPKDIGTPQVRFWLTQVGYTGLQRGRTLRVQGKNLYVLFSTSTTLPILVYDYEAELWSYWQLAESKTFIDVSASFITGSNYLLLSDGKTAIMGGQYEYITQDNNTNFTNIVQTNRLNFDTMQRKFVQRLELLGDQMPSAANVLVSYTDDDYTTFSTARTLDMSAARPFLSIGGNFRRRAYKFSYTGNQRIRLNGFELFFRFGK